MSSSSISATPNNAQGGSPQIAPFSQNLPTDLPIADETIPTGNELDSGCQTEETSSLFNKYQYEEFAGYSGKRLLDKILQQILTYATWRTWHFSDEFVAPGNDCYVGCYRLAEEIRPGIRKVEMDFKALRDLGLMRAYPDYRMVKQASGQVQMQAVIIKDFTALYALAHEYHLWTLSPHYIPPDREYLPLVLADEQLTHKLLRFDNYRRILCCKKPGRKPLHDDQALTSATAMPPVGAQRALSDIAGTETKRFLNPEENTLSPNRGSKNRLAGFPREDSTSNSPKKEAVVAATAIRKSLSESDSSTETGETIIEPKEVPTSKSNPLPSQNTEPAEAAKEVKEDRKGMSAQEKAAAALAHIIPAAHWQEMHGTRRAAAASRALAPSKERARWHTPDWLVREVARQAQELRDDPKVLGSVITRWSKAVRTVFEVAEIEEIGPEEAQLIINKIRWARKKVEGRKEGINPRRRVPYLLECFLSSWELKPVELLYFESEEPLYQDGSIGDFVEKLYHSYERSGSQADFDEWAEARLKQERLRKRKRQ